MIISNCERGSIKGALKLHYEMQDKGLLPALETYHSLIYRLCKERDTVGALTIYNHFLEPWRENFCSSCHTHSKVSWASSVVKSMLLQSDLLFGVAKRVLNHCSCMVENSSLNSLDLKLLESNDFITWLASNAALTIDFGIPASKATCRTYLSGEAPDLSLYKKISCLSVSKKYELQLLSILAAFSERI